MYRSEYSEQCTAAKFEFFVDLYFFLCLKYKEFWTDFFTLVDIIMIYLKIFCPNFFLELSNAVFKFFKNGLHGA
jgi:hypothetical protein